jgi:hypothetical protein
MALAPLGASPRACQRESLVMAGHLRVWKLRHRMRRNGRRARVGLCIAERRHMRILRKVNQKRDAAQQLRRVLGLFLRGVNAFRNCLRSARSLKILVLSIFYILVCRPLGRPREAGSDEGRNFQRIQRQAFTPLKLTGLHRAAS